MVIKCRPFYLPRDFSAVLITAVYLPPSTNNNIRSEALNELYQHISEQQTAHPDAFLILAGDFNHADPKSVFSGLYKHTDFPTRGNNTLDQVFTTRRGAYKASPLPHLGASDHLTIMLMSAYRPLVKVTKPVLKQVRMWPDGSSEALQDCFSTTDWNMFREAATHNSTTDIHEYSETVSAYITKCIDDVTDLKTITVHANQKPWLTGEVHRLLKARNAAFTAGDREGLKTARANLSRGIREAKRQYSKRISLRFSDSRDTWNLWQGIQTITGYKPPPQTCDSTISLLNDLKGFFARFETPNNAAAQRSIPPPGDQGLWLSSDTVWRAFSGVNARKAPGPDNIPGRVLKNCAWKLAEVFTDIYNISLSQAVVPTRFKATTIIPIPKKASPSCFNDYRPVALTSIPMKCFERLVMHHIRSSLPPFLDPYQFAYRSNRSTGDAISTALHSAHTHLDRKDTYVRMLFLDFSSAFNTIIPQQLIHKLDSLGLSTSLCNWLLDFLTGRPQAVRVGSNTSNSITMNTGAPQGCVLSPLLFTLLTHDCTPEHPSNLFIKFADDTTVVGLISDNDETHYRSEVSRLASWCEHNNLSLNTDKTKEIVVDFRRTRTQHTPLFINDTAVERVSSTKFLGVHVTENLSWTTNSASLARKANQRLYFLRKLRRAGAPTPIMNTFYSGAIESILTSCLTVWYGACTASCCRSLQRIVSAAEKIVGTSLPSLQDLYSSHLRRKALRLAGDPTHPLHSFFSLLPSGRRLRSLRAKTTRLKDSHIHQAAQLRAFIPEMLKYSTGRGKPGWGKESCKPIWWPEDIPWANVRSDVRTEDQKQRVSWTQALRTIVKNCYKQHGREDLLYAFEDQQVNSQQVAAAATHSIAHLVPSQTVVQTISNPDGTVSLIQVGTGATVATLTDASELPGTVTVAQVNYSTVTDGEVEQNWATLQGGEMTIQTTQASEATQAVASLAEAAVAASQEIQPGATVTMALNRDLLHGITWLIYILFITVRQQPMQLPRWQRPLFREVGRSFWQERRQLQWEL
ncbi:nuclear respiratory factor 1 isoform X2 [Brachyhypopomus gauderio]|uniref:nuclear respiratory factor 1 isoform X2 n=1 Tax=Brachyhypopomus gauderio TaxID=698409 RepID=UPI00404100A9